MPGTRGAREAQRWWRRASAEPHPPHAYISLLGLRSAGANDLHGQVRDGLPYPAFERLRSILDLPAARVAELLRVPARTLARRRESGRLDPETSDRLVRLSRIVAMGLGLFEGEVEEARAWLAAPHPALGGETPLDFATTEVGAREVEALIGRLEHGVPL